MDRSPQHDHPHAHAVLERVRREGRWWWLQTRHSRRIWRWALLAAALLFVVLVVLRRPLADWFWGEPRIEQLLDQGDRALAAGRLSAADGSGARERYQAALALDNDRGEARDGLGRTGRAALQATKDALEEGDIVAADTFLQLARQLQVPQADSDALALQLRDRQAAGAGLDALLRRARVALDAGNLDDDPRSALPLLRQVLALRPLDVNALEAREDALTDLLQQARTASSEGDVRRAVDLLDRARAYDPGHADLPVSQEAVARALDARLRRSATALQSGRLDIAMVQLQPALEAAAGDAGVVEQRERVVSALLDDSQRLAADHHVEAALARLDDAARMQGGARELDIARQALEQAQFSRRLQQARRADGSAETAQGRRELARLLDRLADAEARGHLIAPPGASAYDALREAQAVAPRDRRVLAAATRLRPAGPRCFEDALRQNRVEAAGACLQAWQTLAPADPKIRTARNRLALRWVAIGSERLGSGDVDFAERAAAQARALQPALADLPAFEARVQQASGAGL